MLDRQDVVEAKTHQSRSTSDEWQQHFILTQDQSHHLRIACLTPSKSFYWPRDEISLDIVSRNRNEPRSSGTYTRAHRLSSIDIIKVLPTIMWKFYVRHCNVSCAQRTVVSVYNPLLVTPTIPAFRTFIGVTAG